MPKVNIKIGVRIFGVVVAVGFLAVVLTGAIALANLKVGGPVYNDISLGKDLIADILPPPEYVLEAYLEATLVLDNPGEIERHRARLVELHKEYDDRKSYWSNANIDPAIKRLLTQTSDAQVRLFWNETENVFLPALAHGDQNTARRAYGEISRAYAAHRAVIDQIVTATTAQSSRTEATALREDTFFSVVVWSVAALVLASLVVGIGWIALRVIRPLSRLTDSMSAVAAGRLDTEIPELGRADEIGSLASALQTFKANALERQKLLAEQAERDAQAEARKRELMKALADEFQDSVSRVVDAVATAATQMQTSASSMAQAAQQTTRQSTAVMGATEQASANVQSISASTEELSSSIAEIGRQVAQSATIGTRAVQDAARSTTSVHGLVEVAQRIEKVIALINDIASQTNLLALNATIEAARAGDAGKGFAVVASEVKALANQTAKATEDVAKQITAIQSATRDTVDAIQGITKTIHEMSEIASGIASAVEEQGTATAEIARSIQQTAAGTQDVASNISGVTTAATTTVTTAAEVLQAAGGLAERSANLRNEVDRFLAKVRAA